MTISLGGCWSPRYETQTNVATPTPDTVSIVSPELANELALPTPTPQPTPDPIEASELVAEWPSAQSIRVNDEISGELTATDGRMHDGTYVDMYNFTGQTGEFVTINLQSTSLDMIVMLLNSQQQVVAYNDDLHKADTNARLELPIPISGTYHILVNAYDATEGDYRLQFEVVEDHTNNQQLIVGKAASGWLIPGDATNADGLYVDNWTLIMPEEPLVVWAHSTEFDIRLDAFSETENLIVKNGDLDPIGMAFDARIVLTPSAQLPAGETVTLHVALQGAFALGGAYELLAVPLPEEQLSANVIVRPVIVKGDQGNDGSQVTPNDVQAAMTHANEVWQKCGITVTIENDHIRTISMPELAQGIRVNSLDWTEQEQLLMSHPSHASPEEQIITAYFVVAIDNGGRYGIAYPTTRYSAGQSGVVLVADQGVIPEAFRGTLAHEIGHILGLNHPDLDDGDGANDTEDNLMFTSEGLDRDLHRVYSGLTPLQCVTARGSAHFLHTNDDTPLVPAVFQRQARLLLPGDTVAGALTTRDAVTTEDEAQFLDVYYVAGRRDETITMELTSTDFDPVLIVEGPDGEIITLDDDGGDDWNARIQLTIPIDGDYAIGVTSVYQAVGAYQLTFVENP